MLWLSFAMQGLDLPQCAEVGRVFAAVQQGSAKHEF
jgi:hypothetical protein